MQRPGRSHRDASPQSQESYLNRLQRDRQMSLGMQEGRERALDTEGTESNQLRGQRQPRMVFSVEKSFFW